MIILMKRQFSRMRYFKWIYNSGKEVNLGLCMIQKRSKTKATDLIFEKYKT